MKMLDRGVRCLFDGISDSDNSGCATVDRDKDNAIASGLQIGRALGECFDSMNAL
jgi:hypothetical protein